MLVHTVYRVRQRGLEHLPAEGAAVVVCNHVSFVDALVLAAASRRPMRFVMDHTHLPLPVLRFVFRTARAIPIAPRQGGSSDARARLRGDRPARSTQGDLVCIFPEGRITTTGELNPFRPGIERILARNPVPVVPMALRGLWGSFFSRKGGAAMRRPVPPLLVAHRGGGGPADRAGSRDGGGAPGGRARRCAATGAEARPVAISPNR